ncbi:hypothetical protein [Corynebacterium liangguodongii]|uniref:Uncharacterized protein n=1 Tax=Corynebacterium liangguodongii TaxID=2079535 RepID=A0A2S0WBI2_9CORY|nr:hypothetical protein [Corynebacterium liangguodongii]AWB83121.1 hypothetical protein C3E79_00300 [Corynebacterium liangguodongii]PWB99278.1 hypothetical protein DF219_06775 [Corynebacterium liangguodongii]
MTSRFVCAALSSITAAYLTSACSVQTTGVASADPATPQLPIVTPEPPVDVISALADLQDDLEAIEEDTGTQLGVSLDNGSVNAFIGQLETLPSWSTIKVPIALAAQDYCAFDDETISAMIKSSIEYSDNASAWQLLNCVGQGDGVLADSRVSEDVARTGSTIDIHRTFGRSNWPIAAASHYAWYLSTLDEDNEVIVAMRNIAEEQSWGLGTLESTAFKGGWSGDRLDGSWHSRQMGFVRVDDTPLGIAIASRSPEGSFTDTTDALDQLAAALGEELGL